MGTSKHVVRWAIAGVLAASAFGASGAIGAIASAQGPCLAWFGSRDDGQCIGYSNGQGVQIGTPSVGVWGPGYGNGLGVSSGPLLPGQTINQSITP